MGNFIKGVRNTVLGGLSCALILASGCSDSPKPADSTPAAPAPPAVTATTTAPAETPASVSNSVPATELQEIDFKTLAAGRKIYKKDGSYLGEIVKVSEKEVIIKTVTKNAEGSDVETETGITPENLKKDYMTTASPGAPVPTPDEGTSPTPAATPEETPTVKATTAPISKDELDKKKKDDGTIEILPPHPAKDPERATEKTPAPAATAKPTAVKKGVPEVPPVIGDPEGEADFYSLTGVMSTSSGKTAMLKMGDKTISAVNGQKLSDDWVVTGVTDKSVTMKKGTETRKLDLKND